MVKETNLSAENLLLKLDLKWCLGKLEWKLHEKQLEILKVLENSPAQEYLLLVSRQFGKSYLVVVYSLMYCLKNPGSLVRIAAPTLRQAADIVNDNLRPMISEAPDGLISRHKSDNRWLVGESELRLGGLERSNVDSLRGANADLVICEEGGFVSSDDYEYALRSVIGPQLLHSGGKLIHVTTPSQEPEHFIHASVMPKCELSSTCFRYTIYDNPLLEQDQIDAAIELSGGRESISFKREYLVEIVRDSSVVCVPEFNVTNHVVTLTPPVFANWLISIDFGGVRDKTVGLLLAYDFANARTIVIAEYLAHENTDTLTIVEGLKKLEKLVPSGAFIKRVADAPGQLLVDLNKHNYNANLPAKDNWEASLNQVRLSLNSGKLLVGAPCSFLIETLKSATFNRNKTDFNRSVTLGHCDALAALMYGVRSIDKVTNPIPSATYDPIKYWVRPQKSTGLTAVANAILGKKG